jgi:predicted DNA-binding transcriptional regulator YafY
MLARELEETKLSANQKIKTDGDWFRIEATVQDTWQLRWWLLSKAVDLTILEPTELRSIILEDLEAAIEAYRNEA